MLATVLIALALAAIVVYAVVSYRKKLTQGCCGGASDVPREKADRHKKDLSAYPYHCTLTIEGMHCQNCAARIENSFNSREDMQARVHLDKQQAAVWCTQAPDEGLLRQIVARAGYHVTSFRAE